jgi:uncharacterized Fe-S center protein
MRTDDRRFGRIILLILLSLGCACVGLRARPVLADLGRTGSGNPSGLMAFPA